MRLKYYLGLMIGLASLLLALTWLTYSTDAVLASQPQATPVFIWPVSGSDQPDFPQSSAYGPRLKAGSNFRYDYHQGIDIPTPISTTLLAVSTGTVRIAGSHPAYSDGVVQLDHGNGLYSNYLHVAASLVMTNQQVSPGQPVALSGVGESGFPHLHFEIRRSYFRADAINPWRYLPYQDTLSQSIAITEVLPTGGVWVQVSTPATQLDLNQVTVTVRSGVSGAILDSSVLDYEARNKAYHGDPAQLDIPDLDGILIQPEAFTSQSDTYRVALKFHQLQGAGPVEIEACAIDLKAKRVCTLSEGQFLTRLYLPLIRNP